MSTFIVESSISMAQSEKICSFIRHYCLILKSAHVRKPDTKRA